MNFLLIIVTSIFFASSNTNNTSGDEANIKKNAIKTIKDNMGDPSSFELVDFFIIDTITFRDNVNYRRDYFMSDLNNDKKSLKSNEDYKSSIPSMYNERKSKDLEKEIQRKEIILSKIDSIADGLGSTIDDIASYTCVIKFRSINEYGAKVLSQYYLQTSPPPELNITNITTERSRLYSNPNDFPGYREMIINHL